MTTYLKTKIYLSPLGPLILGSLDGNRLCLCHWRESLRPIPLVKMAHVECETAVTELACEQLDAYFGHRLTNFSIPIQLIGTSFQTEVWQQLLSLPFGSTTTYGSIARGTGRPRAVRAVAAAIGANPLCIVVPCHRVTGSNGSLTGYSGGLRVKEQLLALESGHF